MITELFSSPISFFIRFAAIIVAVSVHEFAHAYAATRLGDPTPKLQGRLTLNPGAHLDPLGTLMLLFAPFGWGKPVQFDPFNLAHPRRDTALISIAGPVSNFLLAALLSVTLYLISQPFSPVLFMGRVLEYFIAVNIGLGLFNLLPIHPLDGGKVLVGLLPKRDALMVDRFLQTYGVYIAVLLILPIWGGISPVTYILSPLYNLLMAIYIPSYNLI